jgi:hypothetical protein
MCEKPVEEQVSRLEQLALSDDDKPVPEYASAEYYNRKFGWYGNIDDHPPSLEDMDEMRKASHAMVEATRRRFLDLMQGDLDEAMRVVGEARAVVGDDAPPELVTADLLSTEHGGKCE